MLTTEEWEKRLVAHYLRSDGPYGGAPINFLDATPAEIAVASNIPDITPEEAQRQFVLNFSRANVEAVLSGTSRPLPSAQDLPGYFRFLVLTCLVTATESG